MTAGSMARSLLKHFPEFLSSDRCKLFAASQAPITVIGGFFQGGHLLGHGVILPLGVIRGFDVDLAKSDDVGAADDPDILAPHRCREPTAQIFLRVGNRKGFHIVYIALLYSPVNHALSVKRASKKRHVRVREHERIKTERGRI